MGCHALQFFRWILGNRKALSVYAQMGTYVRKDKTLGDDDAAIILEFEGGVVAVAEEPWAKREEWMTARRLTARRELYAPTFFEGIHSSLTPSRDTTTRWKKQAPLWAGASPYTRKPRTTAPLRSLPISLSV